MPKVCDHLRPYPVSQCGVLACDPICAHGSFFLDIFYLPLERAVTVLSPC